MGKTAAKGASLSIKQTGAYTAIPNIGDIEFVPFEQDIIDVTTQDSPNNTEEKIPGIRKNSKLNFPIVWDDTNTVHMFLIASHGTVQSFTYTGAGYTSGFKFNAIINLKYSNQVKGAKKASLELVISDGNTPS